MPLIEILKVLNESLNRLEKEAPVVFKARLAEEHSQNAEILRRHDDVLVASLEIVQEHLSAIQDQIRKAIDTVAQARQKRRRRPHRACQRLRQIDGTQSSGK